MISDRIASMPELIRAVNEELRKLSDGVREISTKAVFDRDIDMRGNRILNVGKGKARGDAVTRREMIELGMFENEKGQHVAHSTLIAREGVRSKKQAREGDDLVPLRQMRREIAQATGSPSNAVVTNNTDQIALGHKIFFGLGLGTVAVTVVNGITAALAFESSSQPLGSVVLVSGPTANFQIAGIHRFVGISGSGDGGYNGQLVILHNTTNFQMTLLHESTGAVTANRIRCPQASASSTTGMVIRRYGSVALVYVPVIARWVAASFA